MTTHPSHSLGVTTLFESPEGDGISNQSYREVVLHTLKKILPRDFFEVQTTMEETYRHQQEVLNKVIPLITCSETTQLLATLSFFALSKYRSSSFKFFFEMISRWLTPGRRLNVVLVYAADFKLTQLSEEVYTICEVMIQVIEKAEFEEIQRNFPIIGAEIGLGIQSAFYAQRILEIKGLTADDKTALIQSFISYLVKRFPKHFEPDVFTEMQHLLVTCRDEFKSKRQARHLCRLISIQYLFRKGLREALKKNPQRRSSHVKIFRANIKARGGNKRVLGVLVGVNLIRDQENFGEKNLIKAIQHYVRSALPVEDSFLIHKVGTENICISYIEIEKKESDFTSAEIRKLRRELPGNLKNHIQYRMHTIFMPRNEEEIMRNILVLSNQIKYVRDIPQVFITFDEQVYSHLYFTVILARLLKPGSIHSIAELFQNNASNIEYIHDRTKIVGHLRKKYSKEATVFRIKLAKDNFLRYDHSIDLYKARQVIVNELTNGMGEIRDYNGGMISKQHELLLSIRKSLKDIKDYDELLLENFFYSLAPDVVRSLIDPEDFKILFLMLLEGLKAYKSDGPYVKFHTTVDNVFALIIFEDHALQDYLNRKIKDLNISSNEIAYASIKTQGYSCLGYMNCVQDLQKKDQFIQSINQILVPKHLVHS